MSAVADQLAERIQGPEILFPEEEQVSDGSLIGIPTAEELEEQFGQEVEDVFGLDRPGKQVWQPREPGFVSRLKWWEGFPTLSEPIGQPEFENHDDEWAMSRQRYRVEHSPILRPDRGFWDFADYAATHCKPPEPFSVERLKEAQQAIAERTRSEFRNQFLHSWAAQDVQVSVPLSALAHNGYGFAFVRPRPAFYGVCHSALCMPSRPAPIPTEEA